MLSVLEITEYRAYSDLRYSFISKKLRRGGNMKTVCKKISMLALCVLMSVAMALAVPKGHGNGNGNGNGNGKGKGNKHHEEAQAAVVDTSVGVAIFVGGDRDMIKHHFMSNRGSLPPGLAKRGGDLPPGLEKQLIRNGHLPPGLEKKLYPFPMDLERRLPPLRPGLTRGIIGGSAVILDSKTKVILDIFAVL
jgi:hypothetical protein